MNELSITEARKQLSDIICKAYYNNEPTLLTRAGKNIAVVISYEQYEHYQKLISDFRKTNK